MLTRPWFAHLLSFASIFAPGASAQTPPSSAATSTAAYDVVSIHDHNPAAQTARLQSTPDSLSMVNVQLRNLAAAAYDLRPNLVSGGPDWVTSKRFDVTAKITPEIAGSDLSSLTEEQRRAMLLRLLEDRFHLKAHLETKTMPVYELVVAKGGPSITRLHSQSTTDPASSCSAGPKHPRYGSRFAPGHLEAWGYEIVSLASQLDFFVGKPVIDKTGLTGEYDFTLDFTPDPQLAHNSPNTSAEPKPDIFTALQQQLGLKLIPARDPLRTLVIDTAELPTPN